MLRALCFAAFLSFLSSCAHTPQLITEACTSNPAAGGLECAVDEDAKNDTFVPYSESGDFTCMKTDELVALLTQCRAVKKGK